MKTLFYSYYKVSDMLSRADLKGGRGMPSKPPDPPPIYIPTLPRTQQTTGIKFADVTRRAAMGFGFFLIGSMLIGFGVGFGTGFSSKVCGP